MHAQTRIRADVILLLNYDTSIRGKMLFTKIFRLRSNQGRYERMDQTSFGLELDRLEQERLIERAPENKNATLMEHRSMFKHMNVRYMLTATGLARQNDMLDLMPALYPIQQRHA